MASDAAEDLLSLVRERIAMREMECEVEGPALTGLALHMPARRALPEVEPTQKTWQVSQLLAHYDRQFVQFSYLVVLGRDADSGGLNSRLEQLQQGKFTRIAVLMRMRYSAEGKSRGIRIRGLRRAYLVERLCALPVLGYCLRGLRTLVYLPRLLREMEELRAVIAMHKNDSDDRIDLLSAYLSSDGQRSRRSTSPGVGPGQPSGRYPGPRKPEDESAAP